MVVGRCQHIAWREKRTKVKISYQNEWLQVFLEAPYGSNNWQNCAAHQLHLEKGHYFGATAATGYLFDNHDIFSWITYNLDPWKQPSVVTDQHADIQQRLDSLTEDNVTDLIQTEDPTGQAPTPIPVQPIAPLPHTQPHVESPQSVLQPVPQAIQQPVQQTSQPTQQPVQHTVQPVQHTIQPTQQPVQPVQQAINQPPVQVQPAEADMWAGIKQLQIQLDALQQQQAQIIASVNQLTVEIRSVAARPGSAPNSQHIFADALEKLLAVVSDTKNVMADDTEILRNNLLDIKHSLATGGSGANKDLIAIVNDVSKKVARVQTAIENAKREQATIVSDLQANKEVLVSKIEEGSSFGFWAYFLFFQVCFAIAFVVWKKVRDDSAKKFD